MEDRIEHLLTRGVSEAIVAENLERELRSGRKLRIKYGIDPTAPDLHLGHTVPLRKLREFQNLGHHVILIIGDFTAKIGDPTGRSKERLPLSSKEIEKNLKSYQDQIGKILDLKKTEFVKNSKWLDKLKMDDLLQLIGTATFQQVKERGEFKKRLEEGEEISLPEFLYPLLQGYDSVAIEADVEVGGLDQKFNLLMGRTVQERYGQKPQSILLTPLLIGLDGKMKMSKSARNYIGVTESPQEMYGKMMSMPDELIAHYTELCTDLSVDDFKNLDPLIAKKLLAAEIVRLYHGGKEADEAARNFGGVFGGGEAPKDAPVWKIAGKKVNLVDLLAEKGIVKSKSEARRLLEQGGITLDNQKLTELKQTLSKGTLRIGKKTFIKIE